MRISKFMQAIAGTFRRLVTRRKILEPAGSSSSAETQGKPPALDCALCRRPMHFLRSGSIFHHFACSYCQRFSTTYSPTAAEATAKFLERRKRQQQRKRPPRPPTLSRRLW